jgi:Raf kinase inhibitor-like YbhB/YbcL family protein
MALALLALAVTGCGGEAAEPTPTPHPRQSVPEAGEEPTGPVISRPPADLDSPLEESPLVSPVEPPPADEVEMAITSSAFEEGGDIPNVYSCLGDNVSPDLAWSGVPADAQSLALFFYDADAGFDMGASVEPGFVHWVVYNVPPASTGYAEDQPAGDTLADGALQGSNDFTQFEGPGATFPGGAPVKLVGYDGPCPPVAHRYAFRLYALDTTLDLAAAVTPAEFLAAVEGHVIDQVELTGVYTPQ